MLYHFYEIGHAALAPMRAAANAGSFFWKNPLNPLSESPFARATVASLDMFERLTRRHGKPEFKIDQIMVDGHTVQVQEHIVWSKAFCNLLHFAKTPLNGKPARQPTMLIVAPMSGHYASLLRGTVETMLQTHDVYITDWMDARDVPLSKGHFDLDDCIDYIIEIFQFLGPQTHVMAVCQPSVPVLAAVSLMSTDGDECLPATMTLMGGPVDTRCSPTAVNKLCETRDLSWFSRNVIKKVPFPNSGMMREVYPGFLQLTGFMTMNLDKHMNAHKELFWHMVEGDGDSAEKHEEFYDEYMSVMDLTAEFYLQTVEKVFIGHDLPRGVFAHRGQLVDPGAITGTALFTVEAGKDDISGIGQTKAAHTICPNIPKSRKGHYLQPGVGHYGVFNGQRFRSKIAPRIAQFTRDHPKSV